jgi:ElaB/YqjD/DUF883 family membrane-anchored ribosome-binding protein
MSSTPSDDRSENPAGRAADDIFAAAGVDTDAPSARRSRGTRKKPSSRHDRKKAPSSNPHADASEPNGDRLREHAADVLAATRERIIERPLQAVLIAAAAGAFAALLLGAGRR